MEGKFAVIPMFKLAQMLKDARQIGRSDSNTSFRQYAKRYEALRDLRAYGYDRQPLRADENGRVTILQGDLLDKFLDEGIQ